MTTTTTSTFVHSSPATIIASSSASSSISSSVAQMMSHKFNPVIPQLSAAQQAGSVPANSSKAGQFIRLLAPSSTSVPNFARNPPHSHTVTASTSSAIALPRDVAALISSVTSGNAASSGYAHHHHQPRQVPVVSIAMQQQPAPPVVSHSATPLQTMDSTLIIQELLRQISALQAQQQQQQQPAQEIRLRPPAPPQPPIVHSSLRPQNYLDAYTSAPSKPHHRYITLAPPPAMPQRAPQTQILAAPPLLPDSNQARQRSSATTTLSLSADTLEQLQTALAAVNASASPSGLTPVFRIASNSNETSAAGNRAQVVQQQQQSRQPTSSPLSYHQLHSYSRSNVQRDHLNRTTTVPLQVGTNNMPHYVDRKANNASHLSTPPASATLPRQIPLASNGSNTNAFSALVAASTQLAQPQPKQHQRIHRPSAMKAAAPANKYDYMQLHHQHPTTIAHQPPQLQQHRKPSSNNTSRAPIPRQPYGSLANTNITISNAKRQHIGTLQQSDAASEVGWLMNRQHDELRRLLTAAQDQWQLQSNSAEQLNRHHSEHRSHSAHEQVNDAGELHSTLDMYVRNLRSSAPDVTTTSFSHQNIVAAVDLLPNYSIASSTTTPYPLLSNILSTEDKNQANRALYRSLYNSTRETTIGDIVFSSSPPVTTTAPTAMPNVLESTTGPNQEATQPRNSDDLSCLDSLQAIQKLVGPRAANIINETTTTDRSNSLDSDVHVVSYSKSNESTSTLSSGTGPSAKRRRGGPKEVDYAALLSAVRKVSSSPVAPEVTTDLQQQIVQFSITPTSQRLSPAPIFEQGGLTPLTKENAAENHFSAKEEVIKRNFTSSATAAADVPGSRMWSMPFSSASSPTMNDVANVASVEVEEEIAVCVQVNPYFSNVEPESPSQVVVSPLELSSPAPVSPMREALNDSSLTADRIKSPSPEKRALTDTDDFSAADELPLDLSLPLSSCRSKRLRCSSESDSDAQLLGRDPLDFSNKLKEESIIPTDSLVTKDEKDFSCPIIPTTNEESTTTTGNAQGSQIIITIPPTSRPLMATQATNTTLTLDQLSRWVDELPAGKQACVYCDASTQTEGYVVADTKPKAARTSTKNNDKKFKSSLVNGGTSAKKHKDEQSGEPPPKISSNSSPLPPPNRSKNEPAIEPVYIRLGRRPSISTAFFSTTRYSRGRGRGSRGSRTLANNRALSTMKSSTFFTPPKSAGKKLKASATTDSSHHHHDSVWSVKTPSFSSPSAASSATDADVTNKKRTKRSVSPASSSDAPSTPRRTSSSRRVMHKITLDNSGADYFNMNELDPLLSSTLVAHNGEEQKSNETISFVVAEEKANGEVDETTLSDDDGALDFPAGNGHVDDNAAPDANNVKITPKNCADSVGVKVDNDLSEFQGENPRWSYTLQELIPKASRTVYALLDNSAMLLYYKQAGTENSSRRNNPYRKFRCIGCDVKFIDRQCLEIHQKRSAFSLQFQCPCCPAEAALHKFINECEFHQHIVRHLLNHDKGIVGIDCSRFQWAQ